MNKTNNFNITRLILSIIVMFFHIGVLLNIDFFSKFPGSTAVESFFVISGYLIFASYQRSSSLLNYLKKRIKRIIPAAYVMIFTSVIMGFFLTNLPKFKYFGIPLIKYITANIIFLNFLAPNLPGVFVGQPENEYINGSLWTLKNEIIFYIFLPIIFYIFRKKYIIGLILSLLFSTIFRLIILNYSNLLNNSNYSIFNIFFKINSSPLSIISFFICGNLLYCLKEKLNKITQFYLIFLNSICLFLFFFYNNLIINPILLSFIVIYFTIYFPVKIDIPKKIGDLSYGIYIYHFPIIQLFINLKSIELLGLMNTVICVVFSTLFCSYLSWHFVEKKFLKN